MEDTNKLLPCPFCGKLPIMQPWHGGAPTKQLVYCENVECDPNPQVSGETAEEAAAKWNARAPGPDRAVPADLRAALCGLRSSGRISQGQLISALACLAELDASRLPPCDPGPQPPTSDL